MQSPDDGLTPLHRLALAGDLAGVMAALRSGTPIDLPAGPPAHDKLLSHEGATALHLASTGGHGPLCAALIEDGASLEARTAREETPLHYALWLGSELAVVGTLLGEGTEVNAVTADGRTPLHFAAASEQYQALVLLLRRGATVDVADHEGCTALHVAAMKGWLAAAQRLVDAGARIDRIDGSGRTPAHWALAQGHEAVARWLYDEGA